MLILWKKRWRLKLFKCLPTQLPHIFIHGKWKRNKMERKQINCCYDKFTKVHKGKTSGPCICLTCETIHVALLVSQFGHSSSLYLFGLAFKCIFFLSMDQSTHPQSIVTACPLALIETQCCFMFIGTHAVSNIPVFLRSYIVFFVTWKPIVVSFQ